MSLIFESVSTVEFEAEEDIEAFVKTMPLSAAKHKKILDGEIVGDDDEVEFNGGKFPAKHYFKIIRGPNT